MILVNLIDHDDTRRRTQRAAVRRYRTKLRKADEAAFLARNNADAARWRKLNPEKVAKNNQKKRAEVYGLTPEQMHELFAQVQYRCEICLRDISGTTKHGKSFGHVDHDHLTGQVRGCLCSDCNIGIGMFADDPSRLEGAIRYLRRAKSA